MIRFYSFFLFSAMISFTATAQVESEPIPEPTGTGSAIINTNRIYGKVIDEATNKPLQAASVQLYTLRPSGETDSLLIGMFTRANGDFNFTALPFADSLQVEVSAVGYKTWTKRLNFRNEGQGVNTQDVGNIVLEKDIQFLSTVVVTAEKPALQMGIDRKVFNVEKSLTAAGGTGIDVMKNIPSVSVDVDGNVQLRNSSPQIFVDGRPTILTLDQIPADNIDRVELITNPSAKFDAASTGGIINVILKKNKRVGFNGMVSAGIGYPDIANTNVNLNMRQGKLNFFVSGGFNQSGGKAKGETQRRNKVNGEVQNYFNQYSTNDRLRRFGMLRFGVDYFMDNRNTLSVSQNFVKGRFSNEQLQDQEYLNKSGIVERIGNRVSTDLSQFNRKSTQLYFLHKFPQESKELSATVNYSFGGGESKTNTVNSFFYPDGSQYNDPARVRNAGLNDRDQITMQLDFVSPRGENSKIETGARSFISNFKSIFSSFAQNNGTETKLPLSNNYEYKEKIHALYATYTNQWKGINYQAGLRAEYSQFEGLLVDSAQKFGYELPTGFKNVFDGLFPSLFLTKELSEGKEMQLNFSRRIRRPGFWHLNPFIDINDPVNLQQGNPQLRPEFTNSFEANYSQNYKGGNFLGVIYYRNNQGDITRYSDTISAVQYRQLNNAAVDPNAILNTFINAQFTNRLGAEFTLQHKFNKNFDVTPTVNMQYRAVKANVGTLNLSNRGFNWEGKLIANYQIATDSASVFNNLSFQLIGEYESPEVVPQGRRLEQYSVDLAFRKDFLKNNKATFTFSINDVFNTHRYGSIYDTETFYQNSYGRRNVRSFRLTLAYKFGDPEFSLLRRNNRNEGNSGRMDED